MEVVSTLLDIKPDYIIPASCQNYQYYVNINIILCQYYVTAECWHIYKDYFYKFTFTLEEIILGSKVMRFRHRL